MKIENIPTDVFNGIIRSHIKSGWEKFYEYDEFDAWIDYGKVVLSKDVVQLIFEWDNWSEGWIEGPAEILKTINLEIRKLKPGVKPASP